MSSTVTMPFILPSLSTTGTTLRTSLGEHARHGLLLQGVGDPDAVGLHPTFVLLLRGAGREQIAERDHAPRRCSGSSTYANRSSRASPAPASADTGSPRRRSRRVATARSGSHQAAGLVLGVREQRLDFFARRDRRAARAESGGFAFSRPAGSRRRRRRARGGGTRASARPLATRGGSRPARVPRGRGRSVPDSARSTCWNASTRSSVDEHRPRRSRMSSAERRASVTAHLRQRSGRRGERRKSERVTGRA